MSAEDRKYLTYAGIGVLVLIILWLLHKKAPLTFVSNEQRQPTTPQVNTVSDIFGGPNLGDLNLEGPTDLALNLSFPNPNQATTSACDCGCDANSPLNAAFAAVAQTINQLNAGLIQVSNDTIAKLQASTPNWLSQYIYSGGGLYSGYGPGQ